jgi:hypothetical protein
VKVALAPEFRKKVEDVLCAGGVTPRGDSIGARFGGNIASDNEAAPRAQASDDARTLWLSTDDHKRRFKPWRTVVDESSEERFWDYPYELGGDLQSCFLARKMLLSHEGPTRFFEALCQLWRLSPADRLYHELGSLFLIYRRAGEYDQLNVGGNACLEACARRIIAIIEAHATGTSNPNWSVAKIHRGNPVPHGCHDT